MQIKIAQIEVEEGRFRQRFDTEALKLLKSSIASVGQLSTIVVERHPDEMSPFAYRLRAGARRLRVVTELHAEGTEVRLGNDTLLLGHINAVDYDSLTPLQRLEVEVEENIAREDFDWKERTRALAALHELRSAQEPGQTFSATAAEVAGKAPTSAQRQQVSDALLVAQHLSDPDVAKAASQKDALKVIRKKAEATHLAKLAVTIQPQATLHTMLKGDTFELIKQIPSASIDVIITDPPYGVGADDFGSQASNVHDYEDDPEVWKRVVSELPDEFARVCKPQAHAYIFCDQRNYKELALQMFLAGWTVFPTMLIWDKGNSGMLPFPDYGPRRCYEAILYAYRGNRKILRVARDIVSVSPVKNQKFGAQKPVAVYIDLLQRSAKPGDSILDCFGGTGPALVAANALKLTATYIEGKDERFNFATTRLHTSNSDDGAERYDDLGLPGL